MEDFDAVIVGSGFGGSVMAARLAEAGWSVCVLERGKAYPPGSFPRSPYDMARNAWDPSEGSYGLFDFWSFRGLSSIVSSGLGGGSLIYSNVMLRKPRDWFVQHEPMPGGGHEHWPITYDDLDEHYTAVETMLDVTPYPEGDPYDKVERTKAVLEAGERYGYPSFRPKLAVSFGSTPGEAIPERSLHGKPRSTCRLVAECNLGCNYGSKNSLDHTYLTHAEAHGAVIRTLSEVRAFRLAPGDGGYQVDYVEHDVTRRSRTAVPRQVRGRHLILAAGTFGSTYLLMKNRAELGRLSPRLGSRFSANGDYLGLVLKARNGRSPRLLRADYGPAITATFQVPRMEKSPSRRGFYIQDAGYPDLVSWMVEQSLPLLTPRLLKLVASQVAGQLTGNREANISSALRMLLGDADVSASSTPLAGMGRDVPDGEFRLNGEFLDLDWSSKSSKPYFQQVDTIMRRVSRHLDAQLFLSFLKLNLLVTVHPLGGVPMGTGVENGVVDSYGGVFGNPGLFVVDGSVMPGPVGANPSLTIAAVAERSAKEIVRRGRS